MTNRIALVTDSTCDIPAAWVKQYGITVIPLSIVFNGQAYLDGVEMTAEQFYERLPRDPHRPTSSQPTPKAFLEAYQHAAAAGAEQVLTLTISSAMSGTIESARRAAQESPIPVTIHDGRNNSMGLGWQVIAAARVREAGGDMKAMVTAAEKTRSRISYYISLDTIEYLSSGGRIADAARFLSSVISIKPLIYVKPEAGVVGASIPARSRKGAIDGMYKEWQRHINPNRPVHVTVLHNNALDEAQALAERVENDIHPQEMFIQIVSPVLGVHTGPKAIALCGYSEE